MRTIACLFAAVALAVAARAADVPFLAGRVVDEAGILSPAARERIEAASRAHEAATTNQVAILTVPALEGESIEGLAVRVFETWKLGLAGKDNGVLLLVAPAERRVRIEVGYGLEGTLTDGIAGSIIRALVTPRFKAGDYDRGVEEGVRGIVGILEGRAFELPAEEPAEGPAAGTAPAGEGTGGSFLEIEPPDLPWYGRILLGAFVFGILGLFTVVGVRTPGAGWFLYFFLIPFWAMFPLVIVGAKGALALLAAHLVGFPAAKLAVRRAPWYRKAAEEMKRKGGAGGGGIVLGSGRSSGSSSGGNSGGGGFSGGGGSSGGGGASGSW